MRRQFFFKIYIALIFASFSCFSVLSLDSGINLLILWVFSAVVWYLLAGLALKCGGTVTEFFKSVTYKIDDFFNRFLKGGLFFGVCWFALVLMWIKPYLSLFPGTFGYDAPLQLSYYLGTVPMSTHHPVVHTLLLGLLYDLGHGMFHTANGGIALYTAVQGIIVTGCIAYALAYMRKRGAAAVYLLLALLWAGFNPFLQALSFNCTKDILFGAFFLLFVIHLHNFVKEEAPSVKATVSPIISGLLVCLFRNQGVYILAVLLIFALLASSRKTGLKKWRLSLMLFCMILFVEGFNLFCHGVLHFESGDSREMLSIPMQQMAYVCNQKLEGEAVDVSDEQLKTVESFIPEYGIRAVDIQTADPVKSTFDTDAFTSDFANNLKTYVELGLQNPGDYLFVFRLMNSGYFEADSFYYRPMIYMYTFPDLGYSDIYQDSVDPAGFELLYANTSYLNYEKVPFMSFLLNPGLGTWLIAILVGLSFYRKDYRLWLVTLPMLLFLVSLFLGPVALVRYIYPLILLVPFMGYLIAHPIAE